MMSYFDKPSFADAQTGARVFILSCKHAGMDSLSFDIRNPMQHVNKNTMKHDALISASFCNFVCIVIYLSLYV